VTFFHVSTLMGTYDASMDLRVTVSKTVTNWVISRSESVKKCSWCLWVKCEDRDVRSAE
jgi:hypothetical protein